MIVAQYLKAVVAALIAGLGVLLSAVEASPPLGADDWLKAIIAFLTALIAVWAVPNQIPPPPDGVPDTPPNGVPVVQ